MVEITILYCKCRFGTMRMFVETPLDLDLYLAMDQRQMKAIDVKYNVRVGYWTSRNNVQRIQSICHCDCFTNNTCHC